MRTLKKVLALTVVLATLLSISSFAAFSDEESIDESFVDAVNLLGALNVMTGDTEGTFRPNDTIMRAEAAKMIYVIRNGGVDDQAAGWTGMSTFSDVPSGAWYEGYVNYCASLGIIAGVGNGLFNPNGAVTGVELAKMLLVVADYKPEIEGYTGAGWNLNVIRDAQTVGMFEGYTLAYSAAATRQQAAQLFSNAILETQMAVYIGDTRVNDIASLGSAATIGTRFFDLEMETGVLTQIPYVTLDSDGTAALDVNNDEAAIMGEDEDGNDIPLYFVFDADPELLYQEIEVVYKESGNSDGLDNRDTVYSIYATGTSSVYETTMDDISLDVNDEDELTVSFTGYNGGRDKVYADEHATIPVFTNYYLGVKVLAGQEDGEAAVLNDEFLSNYSSAPVLMVDSDNDGFIDAAFVTATLYGEVANYNPDRYDFQTGLTFGDLEIDTDRDEDEFALYTFEDDLVEGDIVAVTVDVTSGEPAYTVSLVEPIIGELTRYTVGSNTIVVDGTTYDFYGLGFDGAYGTDDVEVSAESYSSNDLGEEIYLYALGTYVFAAGDGTGNGLGSDFAFVQAIRLNADSSDGMKDDVTKVQLVFADGTTEVYDYYDRDGEEYVSEQDVIDNEATFEHTIVEYYISGSRVTFYQTPTAEAGDNVGYGLDPANDTLEYNSTRSIFVGSDNSLRVSDSSVFFIYDEDDDEVTVYTGAELKGTPEITTKGEYKNTVATYDHMNIIWSKTTNGLRTIAYGVLDEGSSLSETGTFALTTSHPSTTGSSSSSTEVINAILSEDADGEIQEITLDGGLNARRKLYESSMNSDATYTLSRVTLGDGTDGTVGLGSVEAVEDDAVEIDGVIYTVDEDTIILNVDTSNWAYDIGRVTEAEDNNNNILFTADDENTLVNVWVEEDGLDISTLVTYGSQSALALDAIALTENLTEAEAENLIKNVMPTNVTVGFDSWTGTFTDNKTVAGTTYTVDVTLTPVAGTPFVEDSNGDFTVTVSSGATVSNVALSDEGAVSFTLTMTVAMNEITTADVNGLAVPGIKPADAAVTTPAAITGTVNNATFVNADGTIQATAGEEITWTEVSDPDNNDQPDAGDTYNASFNLKADANYQFSSDFTEAYFESLFGSSDVMLTVNADRTLMNVNVLVVVGDETVNTVALTVAEVKTGDTLSSVTATDAAATATATASGYTWTKVSDGTTAGTNAPAEQLKVTFTLTPAAGYVFGDTLNVTFTPDTGWTFVSAVKNVDRKTFTVTATVNVAKAEVAAPVVTLAAPDTTSDKVEDFAASLGTPEGLDIVTVWKDSGSEVMEAADTFSGVCTVEITITLKEGYTWPANFSDANVNATGVSGFSAPAVVSFDNNTVTITATTNSIA